MQLAFDNTYVTLPARFYSRQSPTPVAAAGLVRVNHALAELLGIDPAWLASDEGVNILAGNIIPTGADPIATVYAGHQFGGWNPQLGDGRAVLLGEIVATDGKRYDLQLKGSGQTPYSRMGDGRAPLGPVLREYIVSEAMAALGIGTSRSLAAVTTGEPVIREASLPESSPGGVLARVARSHIRIGTLEYFAARQDVEALALLVDHVIQRHYAEAAGTEYPALTMFNRVLEQQARLVANWQHIGFIHGVMNTDNMLLSGETIDYGPCAFMDTYDPATVYSAIDQGGRYAYRNQPGIAHWNLACLAEALIPLLGKACFDNSLPQEKHTREKAMAPIIERLKASLAEFTTLFLEENIAGLRRKLGLSFADAGDEVLARDFLGLLESSASDFTLAFRRLSELVAPMPDPEASIKALFDFPDDFAPWLTRWRNRISQEQATQQLSATDIQQQMLATNPALIPRNHLVEEVIIAATQNGDFAPFHRLTDLLQHPCHYHQDWKKYASPPLPAQIVRQTFCGT